MARSILFFHQAREVAGTDTFLITLLKSWPAPDRLRVWCNRDLGALGLFRREKIEIVPFGIPTVPELYGLLDRYRLPQPVKFLYRICIWILKPAQFTIATITLYFKIRRSRFDAVISSNGGYPGGELCQAIVIAARIAGVKKTTMILHNRPLVPKAIFRPWAILTDRMISWACDHIVTVSDACRRKIVAARYFAKVIEVIPNGISTDVRERMTPSEKKKVLGLDGRSRVIGAIGTYEERKGHLYLIRAFDKVRAAFPEARLIIIGTPKEPYAGILREETARSPYRDDMRLTGYMDDAKGYIECFEVLVLPSIDFESFGLTILEAMAYAKPVIGTSCDGIPETIGDAGFIVKPADSDALAERIIYIFSHPDEAGAIGLKGLDRLKGNFTAGRMAAAYYKLT